MCGFAAETTGKKGWLLIDKWPRHYGLNPDIQVLKGAQGRDAIMMIITAQ